MKFVALRRQAAVVLSSLLAQAKPFEFTAPLLAYENERYLRGARVTVTARIFGATLHCDGGLRDLRNRLLAQRTPETFWEIDWLYRGIEA